MNLGPGEAVAFARELQRNVPEAPCVRIWVTPPAISAPGVVQELSGSRIHVGAQNVHWARSGAYTGETSPAFAKELGLTYSLVGHSERRTLFGETSDQVALRMRAALDEGLYAIVCIGETEAERAAGITNKTLEQQLAPIFHHLDESMATRVILAYEPVWAIGTGKVASLQEIDETHSFLKHMWNSNGLGTSSTVLYGGSVTPENFTEIISLATVDGALVGGASIKIHAWCELISIAASAKK